MKVFWIVLLFGSWFTFLWEIFWGDNWKIAVIALAVNLAIGRRLQIEARI